jgi:hypothetical protein
MMLKNVTRAFGVAVAVLIGVGLTAAPASAEPESGQPPAAVTTWFAQDAPRVAGEVLGTGAVGLDPAAADTGYTVAKPVRLYDWNPEFLAGSSDTAALATDEWVAALSRNGTVVGTIAAKVVAPDSVAFSYADDDIPAGTALTSGVAGKVVQDPRLGGLVEVDSPRGSKGLSNATASKVDAAAGAADLRKTVLAAHDRINWDSTVDGGAATTEAGNSGPLTGSGVVLAAIALLWLALRRTPSGRRA